MPRLNLIKDSAVCCIFITLLWRFTKLTLFAQGREFVNRFKRTVTFFRVSLYKIALFCFSSNDYSKGKIENLMKREKLKEVWKKNSFLIDLVGRLLELSRDARNACTTWI